ncbi:uncharacterized protein LOC116916198 [Daphnia magna]|uniref:Uncharacterized protein n=1 Tax=Daphnia magna TaxID=35525 RepID=A0A0P5A3H1_9CRUS|nr:uncharacterized protein LOC116916198 [Daphnia magna]KZS21705.1 Uncharacterized protein APZ42_011681 [Daphnia magna]
MSNSSPRGLATATVELVRDTSRRLSADLRDMSRDFGNEFRNMGREIRDIHREIGQRFRSSSLQGVPRIEIPRIGLPTFADGPRYATIDDVMIPQGQELDRLLDDDEESMWSSNPQLCYEDEGADFQSSNSSNRLSIIRSPRTEEILKNVEQALRKTDQALRDMLGIEAKKSTSGMVTPKNCTRELQKRISAPPPSPSNFGLSAPTK